MQDKIPVIGTAIVNGAHWLRRQIDSIDYPVADYIVINNNGRGEITQELDAMAAQGHPMIDRMHMVHMPGNLGCAGSWNLIIKSRLMSPYWLIVGHDVAFLPGSLEEIQRKTSDELLGLIFPDAGQHGLGAWNMFVIRDWVVRDFGLFDENFYPAYCEDVDYIMRLHLAPIRMQLGLNIKYQHGSGLSQEYAEHGSQTWRTDPLLREAIDQGRWLNESEYLDKKWGPRWNQVRPWPHPFNTDAKPMSDWTYDLEFCRRKYLGF
jgi:GT2 family glycosyltransferase